MQALKYERSSKLCRLFLGEPHRDCQRQSGHNRALSSLSVELKIFQLAGRRDFGGRPQRRSLQHGLLDKAVAYQPGHRALAPVQSTGCHRIGASLLGRGCEQPPSKDKPVASPVPRRRCCQRRKHVGIPPGLTGGIDHTDHRLGTGQQTWITADAPTLPSSLQTRLCDGAQDLQGESPLPLWHRVSR